MARLLLKHKIKKGIFWVIFLTNWSSIIQNKLLFTESGNSDAGNILWKFKLDL